MCGRFALVLTAGRFARTFGCPAPAGDERRFNITPDRPVTVVRAETGAGGRRALHMRWGLVPPWSRDPADKGRQINARSETMFEKRTFADAARHRRCLIPASGFYEWQKPVDGGRAAGKQPFWIGRIDGEPMAFAGICNDATPGCAILTMEARPSLAAIHHRMPVMLDAAAWNAWLDPDRTDPEAISASLRPIAEDRLTAWPVSRAVNDPRNDDESLRTPIDPPKPAQPSLF